MNVTKKLLQVFVIPEHLGRQNVVRRVQWVLQFELNGVSSDAFVETFLDIQDLQNYIPANEIGNERLLQWAFDAQGGDSFVAQITAHHEEQLQYKLQCAGQEPYTQGFDLEPPSVVYTPNAIPAAVA